MREQILNELPIDLLQSWKMFKGLESRSVHVCVYVLLFFLVCVNKDDFCSKYSIRNEKFIQWYYQNIKNLKGKIVIWKQDNWSKRVDQRERHFSNLYDNIWLSKMCVIGVPQGREEDQFEWIMHKMFKHLEVW